MVIQVTSTSLDDRQLIQLEFLGGRRGVMGRQERSKAAGDAE